MIKVASTNIESKIKINSLLSDPLTFMLVYQWCLAFMLLYNNTVEVLANFVNVDKTIKGIQIGDNEIKIENFAGNTTIFLIRDITCLNRIQVVLKLYENAKINQFSDNLYQRQFFQKNKPLWVGGCKHRIDQLIQLEQLQFPLKYLKLILVTLFSITPNGTK